MTHEQVRDTMAAMVKRVLADSGRPAQEPTDDDTLTGTLGFDSLDLAVLVVGLEQSLGVDPFRAGAQPVQTFGQLVTLYESSLANKEAAH